MPAMVEGDACESIGSQGRVGSFLLIVAANQMTRSLVVYRISTRACHPADRARAGFDSPPGSLIFFQRHMAVTRFWLVKHMARFGTVSFVDTCATDQLVYVSCW